jgi:hypothetical protein
MCCEAELVATFNRILGDWLSVEQENRKPSPDVLQVYRECYSDFTEWARDYRLRLSSGGIIVAGYLLELAAEGTTLAQLHTVADGIAYHYSLKRQYLDHAPINAALALIEAQSSPSRTLH